MSPLTMHPVTVVRAPRIPGPKPAWGDPRWIRFVHQRDEMLRGDRPAMVASNHDLEPFNDRKCPVCGESRLRYCSDEEVYCPMCWADFTVCEPYAWPHHGKQALFVKPGQDFGRAAFPR